MGLPIIVGQQMCNGPFFDVSASEIDIPPILYSPQPPRMIHLNEDEFVIAEALVLEYLGAKHHY